MTDNETAWAILERLEADGWSGRVNFGDTWYVVVLINGDRKVSASGGNFLEVVQRVEGMTKC
jgi:hypothetical protein